MLNSNLKPSPKLLRNFLSNSIGISLIFSDILLLHELHTKFRYPAPQPSVDALNKRLIVHNYKQSDLIDEINYYTNQLNQRISCFRYNNPYFEYNLLTIARNKEKLSGQFGVFVEMLTDEPYRHMGFDAYSTAHIHWMLQATGWTPRMVMEEILGYKVQQGLLWEPPSIL